MDILIWLGAAISIAGLVGIFWCIAAITRAKKAGLDDDTLRARLKRVVVINFAALLTSVLGLMLVVVGVMLA